MGKKTGVRKVGLSKSSKVKKETEKIVDAVVNINSAFKLPERINFGKK